MDTQTLLSQASQALVNLNGNVIDVLSIHKPKDLEYAKHLAKVVSKLSPLVGNMLEYSLVTYLNTIDDFKSYGKWVRQDPGFPDTLFVGNIDPNPGIEIKTWFPLATEITARFKDSQSHFDKNQTNVALIAWLPEHIFYGKPKIIDVFVDSAVSLSLARDLHYHNPPDYLVFEPEDTSARTINLQQTNTNGFKFQGNKEQLKKAEKVVAEWGKDAKRFSYDPAYQSRLKTLLGQFPYRLDTNFAKMDRIVHSGLEEFKLKVLNTVIADATIRDWSKVIASDDEIKLNEYLFEALSEE